MSHRRARVAGVIGGILIRILRRVLSALLAGVVAPVVVPAAAQERPAYQAERYEEDWSFLRDPSQRKDAWDGWKYVPLGRPGWYLTLGGELRERFERLDRPGFGAGTPDLNGYLLQRHLLSADVHAGRRLRLFSEVQSGLAHGRAGGPRLTDADRLDVSQAFVDVNALARPAGGLSVVVRGGRQEIAFGTGRLISPGESLNVRRSFDGVRAIARRGGWEVNAILVRPAAIAPGVFDNRSTRGQLFWGAGLIAPHPFIPRARVSAYYLGLDKERAVFAQGSGAQRRHTFGSRSWLTTRRWEVNAEAIVQWGQFAGAPIRAAALSADVTRQWTSGWQPRIGIRADLATGDADPSRRRLQTFDPLFPSATAYSGSAGIIGPSNIVDVTPTLRVRPARRVIVAADCAWYWRQRVGDGVYSVFVTPQRPAVAAAPRRVGVAPSAAVIVPVNAHAAWTTAVSRFIPGPFLRAVPPAQAVNYVMTSVVYRF